MSISFNFISFITMKSIIITGCSEWLGYELSKLYIEKWYQVIGISRKKPDIDIVHVAIDLTNEESISDSTTYIVNNFPTIDLFINCAGIGDIQKIQEITIENIETMMKVNLLWAMSLYAKLRELFIQSATDLCFIWATIWLKANEYMPAYSVSKWWLRGRIENVRHDLKSWANKVIAFHPGGLDTLSNIWAWWRDHVISSITSKASSTMLSTHELAKYIIYTLDLPKNMEVSEIIVNRK